MISETNFSPVAPKKPLKIYLCDPVHNFVKSSDIWTIPLNVLTIASYTMAAFGDQIGIRIFKFPNDIFKAIKNEPPDIIGVSNYIWNCELSKMILRFAKKQDANTVTVMGGPNVTQIQPWMTQFMKEADCDYYVCREGEHPFGCLVSAMLNSGVRGKNLQESPQVHGIWYLDPVKKIAILKPITQIMSNLDEIPSPFQNGMVDEFLQQGLMPMIETNRGCPFLCTFCDWGDATLGRVYKYSIDRVQADIDYCRRHSTDERLMIDDANFGLLGKRDLEIAKFIKGLRQSYGWPGKVILTWGQLKSDTALQIAYILKDLCMLTQSSQSMNPRVLKKIKRKNISDFQWKKSVGFCKERNIDTYGELMLPLPGETLKSYLAALRYLFNIGVDFINTNPLILLEGAQINTIKERSKYQMATKWRLLENCYGIYEGQTAIECQEMVIQTDTFSVEDYFFCRLLSWLIQMSWNLRRHDLLIKLCQSLGVNPVDFFIEVISDYQKAHHAVRSIFENFFKDAEAEFFSNKKDLVSFYSGSKEMTFLQEGGFRKLNTYYTARVSLECDREFTDYYEMIANQLACRIESVPANYDIMVRDCAMFVRHRYLSNEDIANLEAGKDISKEVTFCYELLKWDYGINGRRLGEYYRPGGITYRFFTDAEQRKVLNEHLQRFFGMSREYQLRKLQETYHGIHKKHLLFRLMLKG